MKRTLLLTLLLLLFGCDAEVDTQVNMTDLLSSENKVTRRSACRDFKLP